MINLYTCRPIELVSTSRMESTRILCHYRNANLKQVQIDGGYKG